MQLAQWRRRWPSYGFLPATAPRDDSVLEVGLHCGEEFRLEGRADATGFGISGGHRVGGVIWSEGSQQKLVAKHMASSLSTVSSSGLIKVSNFIRRVSLD